MDRSKQIDVRGGKCTYGQMVELGRVLEAAAGKKEPSNDDAVDTIKSLIRALHPDATPSITSSNVRYATAIADGVRFWREQEAAKLNYTPSAEEKAAGYEALSKATGATGVASTIAEKFGVEAGPDSVFKWPYASVFMVLYVDLERYKYQKKLHDLRDSKRKSAEKNRRNSRRR